MSIEKEVLSALKMKQGPKEDRKDFLNEVANKSFDLSDKAWNALSEDAQSWVEAAQKAYNADKAVKDFPGAEKDEDEEERPVRSRRRDDDEEEDKPRGRAKDDDEDDRSSRRRRDDDEDDARSARRREDDDEDRGLRRSRRDEEDEDRPSRSRRDEDDEEGTRESRRARSDEYEEKDPPRRSRRDADDDAEKDDDKNGDEQTTLPTQVKNKIRDLLVNDPAMTPDAIIKGLKSKTTVSKVLVSDIKAEWRATVKHLQDAKLLKKAIL